MATPIQIYAFFDDGTGASVTKSGAASNFTAGSDVVVQLAAFNGTPLAVTAISVSGTPLTLAINAFETAGNQFSQIWYARNIAGGNKNVAITCGDATGTWQQGAAVEFPAGTIDSVGTVVATASAFDNFSQTTHTISTSTGSPAIGDLVFGTATGKGTSTPGGQTETFNGVTLGSGFATGVGMFKTATASGNQTLTFPDSTATNTELVIAVLKAATAAAPGASRSRRPNIHPGKRGPVSQLSHFRRGFRPNTQNATANVTVALTGVAGTAAAGTVATSLAVPMTGNAGTSAVGTGAPATSVAMTGSAATSAVGSLSAQSGAAVGSRRRAMGTSPRVTPYNLRKFYKTARNSFIAASPDVTLALTGVVATSAAGNALATRTVPLTGNVGTAAVGALVPTNAQPVTGNAATSAVGTLAAASVVALTGNAATGAAGSVSSSGTGTASLTGISTPASAGTMAPASSVSVAGVAGTGAAGNTGVSRTVALTGNAASGVAGNVAAGNDIIVAISGVAATSAVGSVKAAVSRALVGSAAAASAGSVAPSGTGVFETGNELVWRVPQRSRVWHLGS